MNSRGFLESMGLERKKDDLSDRRLEKYLRQVSSGENKRDAAWEKKYSKDYELVLTFFDDFFNYPELR